MALDNPVSPTHEYTLADYTITARGPKGIFPLAKAGQVGGVEDFTYDGKPESKTQGGSGANPRAHGRTIFKPTCELTLAQDIARSFERFVGRDGVVDMIWTRQAPGGQAVTDISTAWKPLFPGGAGKSGDFSPSKITGNALGEQHDVKGVIL